MGVVVGVVVEETEEGWVVADDVVEWWAGGIDCDELGGGAWGGVWVDVEESIFYN